MYTFLFPSKLHLPLVKLLPNTDRLQQDEDCLGGST